MGLEECGLLNILGYRSIKIEQTSCCKPHELTATKCLFVQGGTQLNTLDAPQQEANDAVADFEAFLTSNNMK